MGSSKKLMRKEIEGFQEKNLKNFIKSLNIFSDNEHRYFEMNFLRFNDVEFFGRIVLVNKN